MHPLYVQSKVKTDVVTPVVCERGIMYETIVKELLFYVTKLDFKLSAHIKTVEMVHMCIIL